MIEALGGALLLLTLGSPPRDSVRGTVEAAGSHVAVRAAERVVGLEGAQAAPLARLSGLEVTAWGEPMPGGSLRIDRFLIRAARGVAAEDGELAREGSDYVLVTTDGRRLQLPNLPPALRDRVGWRVWLAGPLDRPPAAFGIIAQTRRPEE